MGEYIALDQFSSGSSTSSGSTSSSQTTLFARGESGTRLHQGYGASRIPIRPTSAAGAAGAQYDPIHQAQLGRAAGDPNWNPLGFRASKEEYIDKLPWQLKNPRIPLSQLTRLVKPYNEDWTEANQKKYAYHWSLVKNQIQPAQTVTRKPGIVLPGSNNIGPGNKLQPPLTNADHVALDHDIAYSEAKTNQDITTADKKAIGDFTNEYIYGSNPVSKFQAAVGTIGLGVKHAVDQIVGKPVYGKSCREYVHLVLILRIVLIGVQ